MFWLCPLAAIATLQMNSISRGTDPEIMAAVHQIWAIDNHAHPMKVVLKGDKEDSDYDALPVDAMQPFDLPTRISTDNPLYIKAWHDLYGYPYRDMSAPHVKRLLAMKTAKVKLLGAAYAAWVLDKFHIQTMTANRVRMGRGLERPRFQWVPFDDALLFPLNNDAQKAKNPERASMFAGEERLFKTYMSDLGIKKLPNTLADYLSEVVVPTLKRQKKAGAVALKFEAAYLRSLEFKKQKEQDAEEVYREFIGGKTPEPDAYKVLQDCIFFAIAKEAGELGLPVHLHTGAGVGADYELAGSDPLKLEEAFDAPELRKTKFVLLHGGWPFEKNTAFLLSKPNVFADFSYQAFLFSPAMLSQTLKTWLILAPSKVLFATDSAMIDPEIGWEEVGWLSNRTGRTALGLALSQLVEEGEISRARALQEAHMVLKDNAAKLYHIKSSR